MQSCPETQGIPFSGVQLTLDAFHKSSTRGARPESQKPPVGADRRYRAATVRERSRHVESIGYKVLSGEGDYERGFRGCLFIQFGKFDRNMAEAWPRRGNSTAKAPGLARPAVYQGSQPGSGAANDGEILAALACAVTSSSGSREEVDGLVVQAVCEAGYQPVSSTAQARLHSGSAYVELGDRGQSLEHLGAAVAIDPNNLWGRDAKAIVESQTCR